MEKSELESFLMRELGISQDLLPSACDAIESEVKKYNDFKATRDSWNSYKARNKKIKSSQEYSFRLLQILESLDPISNEELDLKIGRERFAAFRSCLLTLWSSTNEILTSAKTQKDGRPKDIASERWVLFMADFYQTHSGKVPTVSGSSGERRKKKSKFHQFLDLARPSGMLRYGVLDNAHIRRILKVRSTQKTF